jgi:hypothetical protein
VDLLLRCYVQTHASAIKWWKKIKPKKISLKYKNKCGTHQHHMQLFQGQAFSESEFVEEYSGDKLPDVIDSIFFDLP